MKKPFSIVLFVVLSVSAREAFAQDMTHLPETVLNSELQLLGGKTLKLSEYSGKVVLITLFATWCLPCRVESPDLAKLHKEFKARGLVVIELSTEDPKDSEESVRKWVRNFRLPYRVGWAPQEVAQTLMQGRTPLPQTFVIGRDGRIVRRFIGYKPRMTLGQMREAVEEAFEVPNGELD